MQDFEINTCSLECVWKNKGQYWYSASKGKLVDVDAFADIVFPPNTTKSQYYISLGYIPYVSVSETEIIRAYASTIKNKRLAGVLGSIEDGELSDTFWKYYNAYSEISEGYSEFEEKYVKNKLISWCDENGIKYSIK